MIQNNENKSPPTPTFLEPSVRLWGKTLPGVREAIEQQEWKEAQEQIGVLAATPKDFDAQVQPLNSIVQ